MHPFKSIRRIVKRPWYAREAFRRLREYHAQASSLEDRVDWALSFGGRSRYKVRAIQMRSEFLALVRAVEALKPRVIVEIGTYHGGTLLVWSALARDLVISCDLEQPREHRDLYPHFPPPGSQCEVRLLQGDTHDPEFGAYLSRELGGRAVDFLFVDGDHTESGVEQDYEEYRSLVRDGGIIAFHDITDQQSLPTNQVHRFWKRLRQRVDTEEFIDDPAQTGFGIGIVRVRSASTPDTAMSEHLPESSGSTRMR